MNSKELKAHITLLDDTEETVYQNIINNLINEGSYIIPFLEEEWERSDNELVHKRIENIISEIQFLDIKKQFYNWVLKENDDILKGAFLIAKHRYPTIEFDEIKNSINDLTNNAWLEIHNNLTALEKVRIINHILFSIEKFIGHSNYRNDLKSTYINAVLKNKKGSPITLSIIFLAIAQKLNIPIKGVNLINNFILAYVDRDSARMTYPDNTNDVLFYINPFNKGSVFDKTEIDEYLKLQKVNKIDKFYNPISNIEVIQNMILELIKIAEIKNKQELKDQLKELYQITININNN